MRKAPESTWTENLPSMPERPYLLARAVVTLTWRPIDEAFDASEAEEDLDDRTRRLLGC